MMAQSVAVLFALIAAVAAGLLLIRRRRSGEGQMSVPANRSLGVIAVAAVAAAAGFYFIAGGADSPGPVADKDTAEITDSLLEALESNRQEQAAQPTQGDVSLEAVTERLARRLQTNPGDVDGWVLLARSYASIGETEKASEAFQVAIAHAPDNMDLRVSFGELLVTMAGGQVTAGAVDVFEGVAEVDPEHPAAQFYLALADSQAGETQAAYDRWLALARSSPVDAAWLPNVQRQLDRTAEELGIEAEKFVEIPPPTPADDGDPSPPD